MKPGVSAAPWLASLFDLEFRTQGRHGITGDTVRPGDRRIGDIVTYMRYLDKVTGTPERPVSPSGLRHSRRHGIVGLALVLIAAQPVYGRGSNESTGKDLTNLHPVVDQAGNSGRGAERNPAQREIGEPSRAEAMIRSLTAVRLQGRRRLSIDVLPEGVRFGKRGHGCGDAGFISGGIPCHGSEE